MNCDENHILFIPGIRLSDYLTSFKVVGGLTEPIDNIEEAASDSDCSSEDLIKTVANVKYDPLPEYFISMETWIQKTNLKCLYCTAEILGMPWPLVTGMEPPKSHIDRPEHKKGIMAYKVRGLCCSPPCMINYIDQFADLHIRDKANVKRMCAQTVSILCGQTYKSIPSGENRMRLDCFIGSSGMTVADLSAANKKIWKQYIETIKCFQ